MEPGIGGSGDVGATGGDGLLVRHAVVALQRTLGVLAIIAAAVGLALVFSSFGSATAVAGDGVPAAENARGAIALAAEEVDDLRFLVQDLAAPLDGETLLRLVHLPGAIRSAAVAVETAVEGGAGGDVALAGMVRGEAAVVSDPSHDVGAVAVGDSAPPALAAEVDPDRLREIAAGLSADVDVLIVSEPGTPDHRAARKGILQSLTSGRRELIDSARALDAWSETLRRSRLEQDMAAIDESVSLLALQVLAAAVAVVTSAAGAWLLVASRDADTPTASLAVEG